MAINIIIGITNTLGKLEDKEDLTYYNFITADDELFITSNNKRFDVVPPESDYSDALLDCYGNYIISSIGEYINQKE